MLRVLQVIYSFHIHTNFTAKYAIKIPYIPMSDNSYIRCFTEPSNVSLRQYIKQKKVKMSSNNISSENKAYLFNCQLPIHYFDVFYKLLIIQGFLFQLILTRAAANTYAIKGGFYFRVHGYIFKPE